MGAADRLAELGLALPTVAAPVAAYVPAVRSGSMVYVSGQLPFVAGALPATGKVGAEVDAEDAAGYARICALNALAAIAALVEDEGGPAGADALDRVVRVVRVGGFVAVDPSFTAIPGVVNGASTLLHDVLGGAGIHARAAVGVAALPLDSPVEVELVAEVG
ncbi:RidA family protein [Cellulomonas alba]|uniref:RidA family protein n=1 Tax=Cellulomonas alba TaxID=3053467 RepID=A0ABT7SGM1_9CELL|nr:RidA family protein [Cellulomonas alba]MDM7855326.1 RidA family protein [Cellulomonas alba]